MLNDKKSWNLFEMQISTESYNHKLKTNLTNKSYILGKMGLKFQNPVFNILCKIAFWNKQKWLKKIIYFDFLRN